MKEREKSALMMESLSDGISRMQGGRRTVKELTREPFSGSSSFTTERVRALLDDGEWLDVFFKDLNPDGLLYGAHLLREVGMERSRREMLMYRNILSTLNLGTPLLYGFRWEPKENLYWLFLENTGPKRLSRLGDFSLWVDATRWAARLHAIDPDAIRDEAAFLHSYDSAHFSECGRKLEVAMTGFSHEQQALLSQALDRYYEILDDLCALPQHLIHGEYFGKNVMIRPGEANKTIAVIDWETAAFGPRGVDIVSITAGRWTPDQRAAMCQAYIEQYAIETGQQLDLAVLAMELEQVALYRTLWWLGYWAKGDDAHINRWMKELDAVLSNATTQAWGADRREVADRE